MPRSLALLFLCAAVAPPLPAQDEPDHARPRRPSAQAALDARTRIRDAVTRYLATEKAGKPQALRVGDATLAPAAFRREAVFVVGESLAQLKRKELLTERWKAKLIAGGRDPADFVIAKDPGAAEPTTAAERLADRELRQQQLFDKVFLAGKPEQWPTITREAIEASTTDGQGAAFWRNLSKSARERGLPPFWRNMIRQWVTEHLEREAEILYATDGLPDEIAMRVADRDWRTDDAFETLRATIRTPILARAATTVLVHEALRQALVASGHWMTDAEFRQAFDAYRKPLDASPFTVEILAKHFYGFPSLEAYRHYWRLTRSFERSIEDQIDDDVLAQHAEEYRHYFEKSSATVELIPFLAQDPQAGKDDGFGAAERAAITAFDAIARGEDFDEAREEHGQFAPADKVRGLLTEQTLAEVRRALGEGEYTDVVLGFSIAEHLFFETPLDRAVGPLAGAKGYYLARVRNRKAGPTDPQAVAKLREHYVHRRFCEWANDVLIRTVVH